jgi:16S rRNA (cytosine1402-N4)-methyltransferase
MFIVHAIMVPEYHTPVLVHEVLQYLITRNDGVYVDGTLGGGGHAEQILISLLPKGKLIGFDQDIEAISFAQQRLAKFSDRIVFIQDNFAQVKAQLERHWIQKIQGLLFDLGVSSHQITDEKRGFSFQTDARLDMRMNRTQALDAWTVVNTYEEKRLADVFWTFGEERNSRRIAKAIVQGRTKKTIDTTMEFVEVISKAVGQRMLTKTLARIFQAIRIEVNNELGSLQKVLKDSVELLEQGGRIIVISYHSLEDRIVKQFFLEESASVEKSRTSLLPDKKLQPRLRLLTKKPITASAQEIKNNPRARSAKLRAAERI